MSDSGTATYFTYDALNRLHTQKEHASSTVWLEKTYAYASGNVSSEINRDGSIDHYIIKKGQKMMLYQNKVVSLHSPITNDMPRQVRKRSGTGIYHVMLRGINRQDIFEDETDYQQMTACLRSLTERRDESGVLLQSLCTLYAYCLMSNHIHLLIRERDESVSEVVNHKNRPLDSYFCP